MENTEQKEDLLSSNFLKIDEPTGTHFRSAAVWAKTIAGISIAVLLLFIGWFSFLGNKLLNITYSLYEYSSVIVGVIVVFVVILVFYIVMLFRFGNSVSNGIDNQDSKAFERGIDALKILFIVSGVFSALYVLMNVISGVSTL